MVTNALGVLLRGWREEARISLRQFAITVKMDASNYSRIERGLGPKPTEEVLERIAAGFGIVKEVDPRWYEMVNAVSADRGEFPADLLQREDVAASLPAFFRKLRDEGTMTTESMYHLFVEVLSEP
ncbi:helix-turn-helix domain-containing protein [Longimicrobium terrae]|uniref:Transcriptional regulator with XRE-family HTH domain n=1 Tax=Longimicrobium terrae TaxID=1639882 RepID=A0A841H467_9BACT|nr:helix-turn-helix transcriptional regulator [Longimicrobium terrae]MBB6072589.1 transcriptional regulator with XRE-family HTH domain [Longimicrobium terrae]NNC28632.1 helix-turn-helix domain-containing protein [Longimicrobium terrae]